MWEDFAHEIPHDRKASVCGEVFYNQINSWNTFQGALRHKLLGLSALFRSSLHQGCFAVQSTMKRSCRETSHVLKHFRSSLTQGKLRNCSLYHCVFPHPGRRQENPVSTFGVCHSKCLSPHGIWSLRVWQEEDQKYSEKDKYLEKENT